ncbi:MAG TPA: amino acid--tRNA ligase-related protein, partial [Vicinamibacterales bacterium]|nr:amino acid--tRNA ligase-related protein [Vicinamibacterales bacterium]
MSNEAEQIAQRQAKLDELVRLGVAAYPTHFDRSETISAAVAAHGDKTGEALEAEQPAVRLAGRVLGIRGFGKANFLVLSDGHSRIQAYVRADSVAELDFRVYTLLDLGDHVGVEGRVFRTKTNELTVWVRQVTFLAKCLLPMPEKWHGLSDVEIRYRQRYLDLAVNPDSRRVFETRSRVVAAIRSFLNARGFLEVETPMMQPIAGGALARPFVTHHNALDIDLYLRIAPELYLKRLTVGGLERVYEINRNFRNEGISTQHNPEFTMLEFYEAYVDYGHLMGFTEQMLATVAVEATGHLELPWQDGTISFAPPYRRLSLR